MEFKTGKIKLTYTREMEEQDFHWSTENEDIVIMKKLFNQIIEEARTLGFKAHVAFFETMVGLLCEIYASRESYELQKDMEVYERKPVFTCECCGTLIEKIEEYYLNV